MGVKIRSVHAFARTALLLLCNLTVFRNAAVHHAQGATG
jgi:hypothetical protein